MTTVIRSVADATPDLLTSLLKAFGVLDDQCVTDVQIRTANALNSTVAHLGLSFDKQRAKAPAALLLKLNRQGVGEEEVAFYKLATESGGDTSMLVPCVDAAFDAGNGNSHLLLLDVSATHEPVVEREALLELRGVPSETHLQGVTEALARFHATWWEHPLLDKRLVTRLTERYRSAPDFETRWAKHQRDYEAFVEAHGREAPNDLHALYQNALEHHPKLWRWIQPRVQEMSGLTLTHNDCYLVQFLSPKSGQTPTYVVDFQTVCTDFAARDLVYLMATFWTREQRQMRERGLLEHYHHLLNAHGVEGYSLETLFLDYRLMLIDMVFHPVWDTTYGADPGYWQPKLKCLTDAYRDWRCEELFT